MRIQKHIICPMFIKMYTTYIGIGSWYLRSKCKRAILFAMLKLFILSIKDIVLCFHFDYVMHMVRWTCKCQCKIKRIEFVGDFRLY